MKSAPVARRLALSSLLVLLVVACSDASNDSELTGGAPPLGAAPADTQQPGAPDEQPRAGNESGGETGETSEDDILPDEPSLGGPGADGGAGDGGAGDGGANNVPTNTNNRLWPKGIGVQIDPQLAAPTRIADAIAHWESKTALRFVPRTTQVAYVTFATGTGCASNVGRQGGRQYVRLGTGCMTVAVIHEIGHAVGMFHEQSRADRDQYVQILTQNIEAGRLGQFGKQPTYKIGTYDYDSVMHYRSTAFSKNGLPTIVKIGGGTIPGGKTGLAPGDIADLALMYQGVL